MTLRQHQAEFAQLMRDIAAGRIARPRFILMNVTPGGGKSTIPVIAAAAGIPRLGVQVCWLGPRLALLEQAEEAFHKEWLRRELGHKLEIRQSTNDINPARGTAGYASTFSAVEQNPLLHRDEFERRRTILIIDENHHIADGSTWHRAIQPLVDRAALVVLMTGTAGRHDRKPIAWMPTRRTVKVQAERTIHGWEYQLDDTDDFRVVHYTRGQALHDTAIRRMEFAVFDGMTEWTEATGESGSAMLSTAGKDVGKAIWTAVTTEHAHQMLAQSVADWRHQRAAFPAGKLLVVCASISGAKRAKAELKNLGVSRAGIATSEDSPDALRVIRGFKLPSERSEALDALVTVGMAYEGLDVPDITHICSLTHIRSRYWLDQMFSRGTRISERLGPPRDQVARNYVQNDPLMDRVINLINAETPAFHPDAPDSPGGGDPPGQREPIAPEWSEVTKRLLRGFDGLDELDASQLRVLEARMVEFGIHGSPRDVFRLLKSFGVDVPTAVSGDSSRPTSDLLPSQREKRLRDQIEEHVRWFERTNQIPWGTVNTHMKAMFGKGRGDMTEDELKAAWVWVVQQCPRVVTDNGVTP